MKKKYSRLIIGFLILSLMLFTACAGPTTTTSPSTGTTKNGVNPAPVTKGDGKMTDVGTPRSETLIVDILNGGTPNPDLMNPYVPGGVSATSGNGQLIYANLWEINAAKGEQFCDLAADFPKATDSTNTKFTFKIRKGLTWSDGVEFTSADVVFTSDMILKTKEFAYSGYYSTLIKSMKAVDKYTVEVETIKPETRLSQKIGVVMVGTNFKIVPKHIWEKEDPAKFKFTDPVGVGPYKLTKRDAQGNWFLYEKRVDWKKSDVGAIDGEPGPRYILFKYFGPEEKRIMAAIQHNMDILMDITPESWDVLRKKNTFALAWYKDFPYADLNNPCERGMEFNTTVAPYDNPDVRWALALVTNIKNVSMATFGGMLRVSPIQLPPVGVLQDTYHKPMTEWLKSFTLADGYKPFEDVFAKDMVELLKQQGIAGLPTESQAITDTFGIGWWKYDVEESTKLLTKAGFKKNGDKWNKPDGKPWKITINAPSNFEVESMRLAFAVADSWRKFGIDVNVQQMDGATFWNSEAIGKFEVGSYWPACALLPDSTVNMFGWHKQFIVPNGTLAPGNTARWSNDNVSKLLDELTSLPGDNPDVINKITEINKEFVKELPFMPMFGTSKFTPVDTYYWTGFQTAENSFDAPWWWCSQFKFFTTHYKATGK